MAALLLALGTLAACTDPGRPDAQTPSAPTPAPTPLSAFDTSAVIIARADFCGLLPESAVERALGGPATTIDDYGNGERATLAPGVRDISHEYGCTFRADDETFARAWVFAPPVTNRAARRVIRGLKRQPGCTVPEAAAFGQPSIATLCTTSSSIEAAYHGLFVDAWLNCSVRQPGADTDGLLERAGQWCVEVATALDTKALDSDAG